MQAEMLPVRRAYFATCLTILVDAGDEDLHADQVLYVRTGRLEGRNDVTGSLGELFGDRVAGDPAVGRLRHLACQVDGPSGLGHDRMGKA
jgi:hypothetical protein